MYMICIRMYMIYVHSSVHTCLYFGTAEIDIPTLRKDAENLHAVDVLNPAQTLRRKVVFTCISGNV